MHRRLLWALLLAWLRTSLAHVIGDTVVHEAAIAERGRDPSTDRYLAMLDDSSEDPRKSGDFLSSGTDDSGGDDISDLWRSYLSKYPAAFVTVHVHKHLNRHAHYHASQAHIHSLMTRVRGELRRIDRALFDVSSHADLDGDAIADDAAVDGATTADIDATDLTDPILDAYVHQKSFPAVDRLQGRIGLSSVIRMLTQMDRFLRSIHHLDPESADAFTRQRDAIVRVVDRLVRRAARHPATRLHWPVHLLRRMALVLEHELSFLDHNKDFDDDTIDGGARRVSTLSPTASFSRSSSSQLWRWVMLERSIARLTDYFKSLSAAVSDFAVHSQESHASLTIKTLFARLLVGSSRLKLLVARRKVLRLQCTCFHCRCRHAARVGRRNLHMIGASARRLSWILTRDSVTIKRRSRAKRTQRTLISIFKHIIKVPRGKSSKGVWEPALRLLRSERKKLTIDQHDAQTRLMLHVVRCLQDWIRVQRNHGSSIATAANDGSEPWHLA